MSRSYRDWLDIASNHKIRLQFAIEEDNNKDIIYFRGKYIYDLKQAYKIDPNGIIPSSVNMRDSDCSIAEEISAELHNHQRLIETSISANKDKADVKNKTLSKEFGLKIRRLSTRASQVNFATGHATKKDVANDSLGLAKTVVKAPGMIAAKVISKIGPLAITILGLPITLLASGISFVVGVSNGSVSNDTYNNTVVHQMSNSLKDGVRKISNSLYKGLGKL